jgi:hypothetical protein
LNTSCSNFGALLLAARLLKFGKWTERIDFCMEKNLVAVTVAGLAYFLWNQRRRKEEREEDVEKWFENITSGRIPDSAITVASSPGQGKGL